MWVSKIPIPVTDKAPSHVNEVFNEMGNGKELDQWNIFSPVWARVKIESTLAGKKALVMRDKDEFDYAKAERLFPAEKGVSVEFEIEPAQNDHGQMQIELQNAKGTAALKLIFDADGNLKQKNGYRLKNIMPYKAGETYKIRVEATTGNRSYTVFVDGKKQSSGLFFAPVHELQKICFRTGNVRYYPTVDTPTDQDFDVPQTGQPMPEAVFSIHSLTTKAL